MTRIIKIAVLVAFLFVFAGLVGLEFWLNIAGSGFSVSPYIYWLALFGWIFLIWQFKWGSATSLVPVFILFIVAAILTIFGFRGGGETIMRISFIGWLVGIVQALIEYKRQ